MGNESTKGKPDIKTSVGNPKNKNTKAIVSRKEEKPENSVEKVKMLGGAVGTLIGKYIIKKADEGVTEICTFVKSPYISTTFNPKPKSYHFKERVSFSLTKRKENQDKKLTPNLPGTTIPRIIKPPKKKNRKRDLRKSLLKIKKRKCVSFRTKYAKIIFEIDEGYFKNDMKHFERIFKKNKNIDVHYFKFCSPKYSVTDVSTKERIVDISHSIEKCIKTTKILGEMAVLYVGYVNFNDTLVIYS
jgi:hypothetical protein